MATNVTCTTTAGVILGFGHNLHQTVEVSADGCCSACAALTACRSWT